MKVLIVDDSQVNLFSMSSLMADVTKQSDIDTAQDVYEAYELYADGDYDLVITDGDLRSQMTGPMLAQLILSKKPQQAIAAWTDDEQRRTEFEHVFKLSQPSLGTRMIWKKNIAQEQLANVLLAS